MQNISPGMFKMLRKQGKVFKRLLTFAERRQVKDWMEKGQRAHKHLQKLDLPEITELHSRISHRKLIKAKPALKRLLRKLYLKNEVLGLTRPLRRDYNGPQKFVNAMKRNKMQLPPTKEQFMQLYKDVSRSSGMVMPVSKISDIPTDNSVIQLGVNTATGRFEPKLLYLKEHYIAVFPKYANKKVISHELGHIAHMKRKDAYMSTRKSKYKDEFLADVLGPKPRHKAYETAIHLEAIRRGRLQKKELLKVAQKLKKMGASNDEIGKTLYEISANQDRQMNLFAQKVKTDKYKTLIEPKLRDFVD